MHLAQLHSWSQSTCQAAVCQPNSPSLNARSFCLLPSVLRLPPCASRSVFYANQLSPCLQDVFVSRLLQPLWFTLHQHQSIEDTSFSHRPLCSKLTCQSPIRRPVSDPASKFQLCSMHHAAGPGRAPDSISHSKPIQPLPLILLLQTIPRTWTRTKHRIVACVI